MLDNLKKIFILDDESLNIQLLKKILGNRKYRFHTFTSPTDGLDFLRNTKVDLILMDQLMPEINGLEILRELRKLNIQNRVPVIFISANKDEDLIMESFRMGAVDYINKPFKAGEVVARVENHLKIYELENERLLHIKEIEDQKRILETSNKKINSLLDKMNFEIDLAAKTQRFLLPEDLTVENKFSINSYYLPYTQVGGDSLFYRVFEDHIDIFFGDISGHGISAALMSGMVYLAFQMASEMDIAPDKSLYYIHNLLRTIIKNHHLSAIYFRYRFDTNIIEYSYAGHHEIMKISNNSISEIHGSGTYLLLIEDPIFSNYSQKVKKGDKFLFYSDGVIENFNHEEEILGMDKFKNIVKFNINKENNDFLKIIAENVLQYSNQKPKDDMSLLLLSI